MTRLGEISTNADIHGKALRVGSVALIIVDLTKAVSFSSAMPSTGYHLFFQPQGNMSVSMWATSLTVNGFTLNVSAGVAGTISYVAIEN